MSVKDSVHTPAAATAPPAEAEAHYYGPDALGQSLLRAAAFATVGWFGGNWIGKWGTKAEKLPSGAPNPKHHSFKPKNLGGLLGFAGGVMGAYGGLKDTRMHAKQVSDLQAIVKEQHATIGELQKELRDKRLEESPAPSTIVSAEVGERARLESQEKALG